MPTPRRPVPLERRSLQPLQGRVGPVRPRAPGRRASGRHRVSGRRRRPGRSRTERKYRDPRRDDLFLGHAPERRNRRWLRHQHARDLATANRAACRRVAAHDTFSRGSPGRGPRERPAAASLSRSPELHAESHRARPGCGRYGAIGERDGGRSSTVTRTWRRRDRHGRPAARARCRRGRCRCDTATIGSTAPAHRLHPVGVGHLKPEAPAAPSRSRR